MAAVDVLVLMLLLAAKAGQLEGGVGGGGEGTWG